MTRKEAFRITQSYRVVTGYCCYQDFGLKASDLIELGWNSGAYGWNWTLYLEPKQKIFFCSGYRNYPYFKKEVSFNNVRDLYLCAGGESSDNSNL